MSTAQTAQTQYIVANGVKLAYRHLGDASSGKIPLVMVVHFRANMDFWDPLLINALIQTRPVILLDIAGTGKSEGEVPTTMAEWGGHVMSLVKALGLTQIDLLGFSMGGLAVQYAALNAPGVVRRLIICGSRTSRTPNTIDGPLDIFMPLAKSESDEDFKKSWVDSFFPHTPHGEAAGEASWNRIMTRTLDRSPHLSSELAKRQIQAFGGAAPDAEKPEVLQAYDRLNELNMPVFVANGDDDLLIPTQNSVELAQLLRNAHLHIYPNAGHGFLYQYAEVFAKHAELFLDGTDGGEEGLAAKL